MKNQKNGGFTVISFIVILIVWYFVPYRINKADYEKKYNKKLRYIDTLNPKNWDKLH